MHKTAKDGSWNELIWLFPARGQMATQTRAVFFVFGDIRIRAQKKIKAITSKTHSTYQRQSEGPPQAQPPLACVEVHVQECVRGNRAIYAIPELLHMIDYYKNGGVLEGGLRFLFFFHLLGNRQRDKSVHSADGVP